MRVDAKLPIPLVDPQLAIGGSLFCRRAITGKAWTDGQRVGSRQRLNQQPAKSH